MKKTLLFVLLYLFVLSDVGFSKNVVGYYYLWSRSAYPQEQIQYKALTHIVHAFIKPLKSGELWMEQSFLYPEMISSAHKNGVKVLVGLGGFGDYSSEFSALAADSAARKNFASKLAAFCKTNGYDGADLDWEYPGSNKQTYDKANFVSMVKEVRQAFNKAGIELLSAALPATDWNNGYDIAALKDLLDWFGIMTYDYSGPWEAAAYHNSPLYSVSQQSSSIHNSVKAYLSKGMPSQKIMTGIPFYGYQLTASGPYAAHTKNEGKSITYANIPPLIKQGWNYYWDESVKVPYLKDKSGTQFITFDDTNSVKHKSDYIIRNNLSGAIIWELRQDYSSGAPQPLLSAVRQYLKTPSENSPAAVRLKSPENGLVSDTTAFTFRWNPAYPVVSYSFQLSADSLFGTYAVNKTGITFNSLTVSSLQRGKSYYWRVAGYNSAGTGQWSDVWTIKLESMQTAVNDFLSEAKDKEEPELNNYPNPFNPLTRIRYTVISAGNVSLKVFDIIGKEIAVIVDEQQQPGTYEYNFNGKGLTSGIYFYQLKTGDRILTRKMVLNK